jgi:glucosamine--fructose-6-phosphate aminotransferase (isomerizing)
MAGDQFHTYDEITSQTDAWAQGLQAVGGQQAAINAMWKEGFGQILYTGCGSTYYLSMTISALLRDLTGVDATAAPASELLLYPHLVYPQQAKRTLLIASSRSGRTTETLRAVEAFRRAGRGSVLAVTNYPDSPLVELADLVIGIPEGQEIGTAQTKSFTSMYLASVAIATLWADRIDLYDQLEQVVPVGQRLLRNYGGLAKELAHEDIDSFYYLGSGPRYGLACEACLKLKEISLTPSEPFHFLEFRHGPMSMVNEMTAVVGLMSEASYPYEADVLDEMRALGAKVVSVGEEGSDVSFHSGLPEPLRGVLYLPPLQLVAYYRATERGRNPDTLNNLNWFIELDLPADA